MSIGVCDNVRANGADVDCDGLLKDFEAKRITGKEVVARVKKAVSETSEGREENEQYLTDIEDSMGGGKDA